MSALRPNKPSSYYRLRIDTNIDVTRENAINTIILTLQDIQARIDAKTIFNFDIIKIGGGSP